MPGDGLAPLRDFDQIRSFLVGTGPLALFDLPWMPFYIFLCFLFHPWIGIAALILLIGAGALSWFATRNRAVVEFQTEVKLPEWQEEPDDRGEQSCQKRRSGPTGCASQAASSRTRQ